MKVVERVLEAQSNMGGERVGMAIDPSALAHIMAVLTDLYSDPELAVIREYSTNALDSHVEAGIKRPIEVTLPSNLSPFFRVRDYGVGLDAEGIRDVYSQYGTSTKRDSNDVVGMLGLGCKSALTYSDQFTLTGIKDGIMTQVSVSRDEDGSGSMVIVAQQPTDAEQGVEVIVPAKRHNAFEAKAFEFFKFWDEELVRINGEKPKKVDGIWLNDSLCLLPGASQSYVVMGNVPYPIPDDFDPTPVSNARHGRRTHATVAFVPIGAVQFTPSREALQMTKLTKDTLARIKADVATLLHSSLQDQITNAPDSKEARRIAREGHALGLELDFTYKGHKVVDRLDRTEGPDGNRRVAAQYKYASNDVTFLVAGVDSWRRKSGERTLTVSLEAAYSRKTLWFKNFTNNELSPTMREKMRAWAAKNGIALVDVVIVLTKEYTADELFWLDGNVIHDWERVAEMKLAKAERTLDSGRPRGSYQGRKDGAYSEKIVADTIDTSKPLLWFRGNRSGLRYEPEFRAGIVPDEATVIALPENRIAKFLRDFPTAQKLSDFGKEYVEGYFKKLPQDVREAIAFQARGQEAIRFKKLDESLVNDPMVKKAIRLAKMDVATHLNQLHAFQRWFQHGTIELTKDAPLLPHVFNVWYPLLPHVFNKDNTSHTYFYLNAAYAAAERSA